MQITISLSMTYGTYLPRMPPVPNAKEGLEKTPAQSWEDPAKPICEPDSTTLYARSFRAVLPMLTESKTSHMTHNGSGLKGGTVGDLAELQKREYILKDANPLSNSERGL
jgi:hypothetical protein